MSKFISLHSKTGWLYSWLRLFSNKSTAIVILSCCVLSILLGILIAVEAINKEMCRSFKQREIAIFVILFSVANNTLCNDRKQSKLSKWSCFEFIMTPNMGSLLMLLRNYMRQQMDIYLKAKIYNDII